MKVGDKVKIKSLDWYKENKDENGQVKCGDYIFTYPMTKLCGKTTTIIGVNTKDCYYIISGDDGYYSWTYEMFECKVEEETKPQYEDEIELIGYSSPKQFICPIGYEFKDENGNVINATKIVLEKKKPKYPITYEECCAILGFHYDHYLTYGDEKNLPVSQDESDFIDSIDAFAKLIICRNAYWKIAGEEMGLGKPWEPDWSTEYVRKYVIEVYRNNVRTNSQGYSNTILAFPTAEMRDAFKANFDSDIEICKKML